MGRFQLIDYGGGNVGSVRRCLERLAIPYEIVDAPARLRGDLPLLLPGVGAFGAVMGALAARRLDGRLRELLLGGTPYLGICVGLQVLFEDSEESPGVSGLGVLPGRVLRLRAPGLKVPQIGWNRILPTAAHPSAPPGHVYFVNSYVAVPEDPAVVLYEADHGGRFCAAVRSGRITAVQFHPERSGAFGHGLVRDFFDHSK